MPTMWPNGTITFPFSGIQSGFVIHPYHMTDVYLELSGIETSIGFNPLNGFSSITARISGIESGYWNLSQEQVNSPLFIRNIGGIAVLSGQNGTALQDGFITAVDWTSFNSRVFRAGDTITGGLTVLDNLSGFRLFDSGIRPVGFIVNLGTVNSVIGSKSDNVYTIKGILAGSGIGIVTTANDIIISATGTFNIPAAGTSVTMPAVTTLSGIPMFSGTTGGGFLNSNWSFGDAITMVGPSSGVLKIGHNGSVLTVTSGFGTIGTTSGRFSGVFTNYLNNGLILISKYNEVPAGGVDNIRRNFSLAFPPYLNSTRLFKNGVRMTLSGIGAVAGTEDYTMISGNVIQFVSPPMSGVALICDYDYLG